MTRKSVLLALGVAVFMGTMAGAALAESQGRDAYGSSDPSLSADPEGSATQPDAGEIREPMGTGSIPDRPMSSYDLHSSGSSEEPTVEIGGQTFRPDIDLGP